MIKQKRNMDAQAIVMLILIGIASGILSGLIGIGGGIVIVPALVFFLGFSQLQAQGTSLGILLLPVGLLAVLQFYKAGHIDIKAVGIVALAFLVGGYFGSKIALSIPQEMVKKIFAILLIVIAVRMLFFGKKTTSENTVTTTSEILK